MSEQKKLLKFVETSCWQLLRYQIQYASGVCKDIEILNASLIFTDIGMSVHIVWDEGSLFYSGTYSIQHESQLLVSVIAGSKDVFGPGTTQIRRIAQINEKKMILVKDFANGEAHTLIWSRIR